MVFCSLIYYKIINKYNKLAMEQNCASDLTQTDAQNMHPSSSPDVQQNQIPQTHIPGQTVKDPLVNLLLQDWFVLKKHFASG